MGPTRYEEEIKYPFSDGKSPRGYKIELDRGYQPPRDRPTGYKQELREFRVQTPAGYQVKTLKQSGPSGYQSELTSYQNQNRQQPSSYQRERSHDDDVESHLLSDPYPVYDEETADYIFNHQAPDDDLSIELPPSPEEPSREEESKEREEYDPSKASPYRPLWRPVPKTPSPDQETFRDNIVQRWVQLSSHSQTTDSLF